MNLHGATRLFGLLALVASIGTQFAIAEDPVDTTLPAYRRTEPVKGKLTLAGSNTMSQVAATWGNQFHHLYPEAEIEIQVKGAVNSISSVMDGTADIGMLSRSIEESEVRAFHAKFGYVPTILTPALEPQAIYVHKDNPIESLSLSQLDAIFSTTLKRGEKQTAKTWGELGLTGMWATVPIHAHGRSNTTGSQVFFQSAVMGGGEFRQDMVSHASNLELISALTQDIAGIGFTGSTFENPDVKTVPITWRTGEQPIDVQNSAYPLTRRLQLIVNKNPQQPLSPLQMEFIKYVFSQSGQQDVVINGFLPIPSGVAHIALEAVGEKTLN